MELAEQEQRTKRWLERKPEDYPAGRECPHCDVKFEKYQIEEHTAHLQTHNPTPAQWAEAHDRIQKGKEKGKQVEKDRA